MSFRLNVETKATVLTDFYKEVYLTSLKGGDPRSVCDDKARNAVEDLQIFIDGYIESYCDRDMVVDIPDEDIPFGKQESS